MNGLAKMQERSECVLNAKAPIGTGKREFIIYKATNQINGKSYIGQTVRSLDYRRSDHIRKAKAGGRTAFYSAIRKYGSGVFLWEVICHCSLKSEANTNECKFIKAFNSKAPSGYNSTDGGDGRLGFCPSSETRSKVSMALKGRKKTEEHRIKLSNALKGRKTGWKGNVGRKHSDEARAKMSKALLGNKHMVGRKLSEKTKAKISNALKGRKLPEHQMLRLIGNKYSLGHKHSAEHKEKNRIAHIGQKTMLGKHLSAETKAKIGKAFKGRKLSEETKAKISEACKGRSYGKLSDEMKTKISFALKGTKKSEETRMKMSIAMKQRRAREKQYAAGAPPLMRVK